MAGTPAVAVPVPSLPGTPGHFDNGRFSFDYPTDWPVLAADVRGPNVHESVVAVMGLGAWRENCASLVPLPPGALSGMECNDDVFDVPSGGILLDVYWRGGGPAPTCEGNTQANATVGPNPVQLFASGSMTRWEIRASGAEFGWPNNPIFEAHTSDAGQLAKAEAVVASFRWKPGYDLYGSPCSPEPS